MDECVIEGSKDAAERQTCQRRMSEECVYECRLTVQLPREEEGRKERKVSMSAQYSCQIANNTKSNTRFHAVLNLITILFPPNVDLSAPSLLPSITKSKDTHKDELTLCNFWSQRCALLRSSTNLWSHDELIRRGMKGREKTKRKESNN